MATITKRLLSGSVDGQGIGVTASKGATHNTIHVAGSAGTAIIDEVYLYAQNDFTSTLNIVFEFGNSATNSTIIQAIPPQEGPQLVVPGFLILGSATAAVDIMAYVGNTNSLATSGSTMMKVFGFVNRIDQS